MSNHCPSCLNPETVSHGTPSEHLVCPLCGHLWATPAQMEPLHPDYYAQLRERNKVAAPEYERKMADRLRDLAPLLRDGLRVLEVGCAEGELGRRIKAMANVEYVGIELSADADAAAQVLDRVSRKVAAELDAAPFDLILSFHVLEHIPDIGAETRQWYRLLKPSGLLLVEVPNEAGHPLLSWDANPEHLHHFSSASLSALLDHVGFAIRQISTGHFESVVYADSLRVLATPHQPAQDRRAALVARFRSVFHGPFVIYGIGGDFKNYVAPVLADLNVVALVDSNSARIGQTVAGRTIEPYDAAKFAGLPVLVASLRFQQEVTAMLQQQGVPAQAICGLDAIYG